MEDLPMSILDLQSSILDLLSSMPAASEVGSTGN